MFELLRDYFLSQPTGTLQSFGDMTMRGSIVKVVKGLAWLVREIVSLWLWTLIMIKILAYDIEDEIIRYFPWINPLFRFRFFIIIALFAVALLLLNRKSFRHTILFIAFYPLVLFGWRVPKLLWRNWAITLIFLPTIVAFASTIKRRFIVAAVAILSAFTIVIASQRYLIATAMALLLAVLIIHYVDRFVLRMEVQRSSDILPTNSLLDNKRTSMLFGTRR